MREVGGGGGRGGGGMTLWVTDERGVVTASPQF